MLVTLLLLASISVASVKAAILLPEEPLEAGPHFDIFHYSKEPKDLLLAEISDLMGQGLETTCLVDETYSRVWATVDDCWTTAGICNVIDSQLTLPVSDMDNYSHALLYQQCTVAVGRAELGSAAKAQGGYSGWTGCAQAVVRGFPAIKATPATVGSKAGGALQYAGGVLGLGPFWEDPANHFLGHLLPDHDTFYFYRECPRKGVAGEIPWTNNRHFKGFELPQRDESVLIPADRLDSLWQFPLECRCMTIWHERLPIRVRAPKTMLLNQSLGYNIMSKAFCMGYVAAFDRAMKIAGGAPAVLTRVASEVGNKKRSLITHRFRCSDVDREKFKWPGMEFCVRDIYDERRPMLFNGSQGTFFGSECHLSFAYDEHDHDPSQFTIGWASFNSDTQFRGRYPQMHFHKRGSDGYTPCLILQEPKNIF